MWGRSLQAEIPTLTPDIFPTQTPNRSRTSLSPEFSSKETSLHYFLHSTLWLLGMAYLLGMVNLSSWVEILAWESSRVWASAQVQSSGPWAWGLVLSLSSGPKLWLMSLRSRIDLELSPWAWGQDQTSGLGPELELMGESSSSFLWIPGTTTIKVKW